MWFRDRKEGEHHTREVQSLHQRRVSMASLDSMTPQEKRLAYRIIGYTTGGVLSFWTFHYYACTFSCDSSIAYRIMDGVLP